MQREGGSLAAVWVLGYYIEYKLRKAGQIHDKTGDI